MIKKKMCTILLILSVMIGMGVVTARAENIDPDNDDSQYAYGENVGYLNFEPGGNGGSGAEVTNSAVTGYIWGENIGWINLSPTSYGGVANDGAGNLSGYAWGENVGWINFAPTDGGVTIGADGVFDGWAWGENIGWLHLENPAIPYRVKTAWMSNQPPVAICRDVTVSADANCSANASVDDGSNDPDVGDTITLSQSPAGPYPLGETTVTLTVTDNHDASSSCQATVTVVDDTLPVITLNGADPMTVECHTGFTDPGATANDSCAGTVDVTASGSVDPSTTGTYTITYSATDGSGNTATETRTVNVVDTTAPVITLNGADPMTVECHTGFTDPGATANDSCAGTVDVTASGSVDPNTTGTYTITYSATDGSGNTATETRTVNVVDTTAPTITLKPSITYWSPDHKYKKVNVSQMVQGVSDGCDSVGINDVVIERVTSDEPDNVTGNSDGNTRRDIVIDANCKFVQLRSERDGLKNGRVYVITLRVKDASGNDGLAEFKVTVPLSQNQLPAIQDAVAYTVTSSCL